jgi:hypothetical protein
MDGANPAIPSGAMLMRVFLAAGAVALITFAVTRTNDRGACDSARNDAFAVGIGGRPVSDAPGVGRRVVAHCRGAQAVVDAAGAFLRVRAVDPAASLAEVAVRREPERRDAWAALSRALEGQGDSAGARRALGRARELDPLAFRQ